MAEVLVATDELTVLGGPATVTVDLDFGPKGDRGSYIFVGQGDPREPSTIIGQDIFVFDMYINLRPTDEDYLTMYQYQKIDDSYEWTQLVNLSPNTFSMNYVATFINGQADLIIPVANIISLSEVANITSANFNIQYSILNQNPVASSLVVEELDINSTSGVITLPLTINAVEYSSGSWSNLVTGSGQSKIIHLFITVV